MLGHFSKNWSDSTPLLLGHFFGYFSVGRPLLLGHFFDYCSDTTLIIARVEVEIARVQCIRFDECMKQSLKSFHVQVRNMIMMILVPRKLHVDDCTQAAYLEAAVSRVSF